MDKEADFCFVTRINPLIFIDELSFKVYNDYNTPIYGMYIIMILIFLEILLKWSESMEKLFIMRALDYYISRNIYTVEKTPERSVDNYEIELYETSGSISVINGQEYKQSADNILISSPGDRRYSLGSFECFYVHFSCMSQETARIIAELPKVFVASDGGRIRRIFSEMTNSCNMRPDLREMFLQGKLSELISIAAADFGEGYTGRYAAYTKNIADACAYMEKYFGEKILLKDIARAASLSPVFFHTVFGSIKGCTPAEYLTRIRISSAKSLLRGTSRPLAEISVQCGFGSQAYFCCVFKKITGISPKQYRDRKQLLL